MNSQRVPAEAFLRGARMLCTAPGPAIAGYLEDPSVVEVMLNPHGRVRIDRLSGSLEATGTVIAPADAERILRLIAHHVDQDLVLEPYGQQEASQ